MAVKPTNIMLTGATLTFVTIAPTSSSLFAHELKKTINEKMTGRISADLETIRGVDR